MILLEAVVFDLGGKWGSLTPGRVVCLMVRWGVILGYGNGGLGWAGFERERSVMIRENFFSYARWMGTNMESGTMRGLDLYYFTDSELDAASHFCFVWFNAVS